jgi:glutathione S-transferase
MRARLAIDASRQECELREILLRDKPAEMLKASPKGTVPVLIDTDGTVIDESLDIMLWALRRNDPEGWLGQSQADLDKMLALIRRIDSEFKPQLDRFKYPSRYASGSAIESRDEASKHLVELDGRLQKAPYVFGERVMLVDMAIMPFIRQFANVDSNWFAAQSWPALHRWLEELVDSPRQVRIMRNLDVWKPGLPGIRFPFMRMQFTAQRP